MTKVSARVSKALHASVDDLINTNPELATSLSMILANLTGADTAVEVQSTRRTDKVAAAGKRTAKVVEVEEDEDDLAPVTRRGRTAAAAPAKPTRGTRAAKVVEVEEVEDDETVDGADLESLDEDDVLAFLDSIQDEYEIDEEFAAVKIRELSAAIKEYGLDPAAFANDGETRSERANTLRERLTELKIATDKIAEFGHVAIAEAYEQVMEEELVLTGRASTKDHTAAVAYLKMCIQQEGTE